VNSLPKTVTRQRCDCDLTLGERAENDMELVQITRVKLHEIHIHRVTEKTDRPSLYIFSIK